MSSYCFRCKKGYSAYECPFCGRIGKNKPTKREIKAVLELFRPLKINEIKKGMDK
jgi:hypothetical protein